MADKRDLSSCLRLVWTQYSPFFSVLKGERAAVSRALRTMKLPGTWEVYRSRTRSGEFWLCDPCNDESMMKREAAELNCYSVKVLKKFYKGAVEQITPRAAEARRYRDATPAGRLAIDIEQEEKKLSFARTWRMTETARQSAERLAELKAQLGSPPVVNLTQSNNIIKIAELSPDHSADGTARPRMNRRAVLRFGFGITKCRRP